MVVSKLCLVLGTPAMALTRMGRVWGLAATAPPDGEPRVAEGLLWTPTRIPSPPVPLDGGDAPPRRGSGHSSGEILGCQGRVVTCG